MKKVNEVKNLKQGFTLLELLVVVVIIGILAAIALPQYKLAIAKSRFAAINPLIASIIQAQQMYYLQNGRYTYYYPRLDLGIELSGHNNNVSNGMLNEHFGMNFSSDGTITILYCPNVGKDEYLDCINKLKFTYVIYFTNNSYRVKCYNNTDFGKRICNSLLK